MKWFKLLSLGVMSFFLVLLDVAYFSSLPIMGTTILTSLDVLLVVALLWPFDPLLVFATLLSVFFSIFSSLPLAAVFLLFFLMPLAVAFLRQRFLPGSSRFVVLIMFVISCLLAELIMLAFTPEWSKEVISPIGYFVLLNSILGMLIYEFSTKVQSVFRGNEIKL